MKWILLVTVLQANQPDTEYGILLQNRAQCETAMKMVRSDNTERERRLPSRFAHARCIEQKPLSMIWPFGEPLP